ncbi:rRNA maturation RNase YbeY [bacterium]|nr:rRNA maturation RNase YbeY [bacterium]
MKKHPRYLVNLLNRQRLVKISDFKIKELIDFVLGEEKAPRTMGMNIMLVRDPVIRRYHKDFMGIDSPTDCISFPPEGLEEANVLEPACGDVVLSVDHALSYSLENDILFAEEIVRYAVHGTLHCLGYDDIDPGDRRRMFAKQEKYVLYWKTNLYTTK